MIIVVSFKCVKYFLVLPKLKESVENVEQDIGHLCRQSYVGEEVLLIRVFDLMTCVRCRISCVDSQFVFKILDKRK